MGAQGAAAGTRDRRRQLGGVLLSVVLVVVAILLAGQGDGGEEAGQAVESSVRLADAGDLEQLAASLGHPLYWAGERPPAQLELTAEADGSVYLRYLPPGVEAGDPQPLYLTVGTYPVPAADAALRRTAAKAGSKLGRSAGGGVTLVNPDSPTSAYLAYPGSDLQIEVYDPAPRRALRLIEAGAIEPVG